MGAAPQAGEGMGEEGTKGWGCTRGGMGPGEGGKRGSLREGREKAAAEESRPLARFCQEAKISGRPRGGQSKCFWQHGLGSGPWVTFWTPLRDLEPH